MLKKPPISYVRNMIFGAEDSLVSTVGVLFGLASSQSYSRQDLILAGLIIISVESLSMGAGAFLTETSTHEIDTENSRKDNPLIDGIVMLFSYFTAGFVPVLPYILLENTAAARYWSVVAALLGLFVLGYLPTRKLKSAVRMVVVAGAAIMVGFTIGSLG